MQKNIEKYNRKYSCEPWESQTVLNAAHVDVDWEEGARADRVHEFVRVTRVQVAHEVPGAVHERVHRVRLASCAIAPALRTAHMQPPFGACLNGPASSSAAGRSPDALELPESAGFAEDLEAHAA